MQKIEFIKIVESERAKFDITVEKLQEHNDLLTPIGEKWLVKDMIAHIVWYEKEMITLINSKSMTNNEEIWNNPTEKRNQLVYEIVKDLSSKQVINNYQQIGQELIQLFKDIDPLMYSDPSLYAGMPSEWVPYVVFKGNTYTHYPDHYSQLAKKFDYL